MIISPEKIFENNHVYNSILYLVHIKIKNFYNFSISFVSSNKKWFNSRLNEKTICFNSFISKCVFFTFEIGFYHETKLFDLQIKKKPYFQYKFRNFNFFCNVLSNKNFLKVVLYPSRFSAIVNK